MIAMSLIDLVAYLACGVFVLAMIVYPERGWRHHEACRPERQGKDN